MLNVVATVPQLVVEEALKVGTDGDTIQLVPVVTAPGAIQLEVAPDKAKLVKVPVFPLPEASGNDVMPVLVALEVPWLK